MAETEKKPASNVEDQFTDKGPDGLLAEAPKKTELAVIQNYLIIYGGFYCMAIAFATAVMAGYETDMYGYVPGISVAYTAKLQFLKTYELGYVYLALIIITLTRMMTVLRCSAARSQARVANPDQHAYMLHDKNIGEKHYVLMANTGALGKWNRSQRAHEHMIETQGLFVGQTILAGFLVGPVAAFLCVVWGVGRFVFMSAYQKAAKARVSGFLMTMVPECFQLGLCMCICARCLLGNYF